MFKIVERTANYLKKLGVENYDIYAVEGKGTGIEVKEGKVDRIKTSQTKGVAIRVVIEGKLGFAYTNDVSDDGIKIAIECARENAKCSEPDEYNFSMPENSSLDLKLSDDDYDTIPIERKIELAKELESLALDFDSRVKRVRKASYGDGKTTVYYFNSNDHNFSYTTTNYNLSILLAAEESESSQIGWDFQSSRFFHQLNPKFVAVTAAKNAVELLGAKPIKTKRLPVIFKNYVFAELIETLSAAFLGNNVLRKKSLFADKLSHEIANHPLTIYDDPHHPDGTGSCPYDDEGVVTRKKAVVERGILKNFLVDMYSAKKLGLKPTGNGIRASISSLPTSGITNLIVERGALGLEEMLKTPEEVIVVTDAMGIHTVNPISGEFSIGISGIYYVDGKKVTPVTGMTVAGNMKELLKNITEVGADQKWLGNVCSPSVLVKELTVSGE